MSGRSSPLCSRSRSQSRGSVLSMSDDNAEPYIYKNNSLPTFSSGSEQLRSSRRRSLGLASFPIEGDAMVEDFEMERHDEEHRRMNIQRKRTQRETLSPVHVIPPHLAVDTEESKYDSMFYEEESEYPSEEELQAPTEDEEVDEIATSGGTERSRFTVPLKSQKMRRIGLSLGVSKKRKIVGENDVRGGLDCSPPLADVNGAERANKRKGTHDTSGEVRALKVPRIENDMLTPCFVLLERYMPPNLPENVQILPENVPDIAEGRATRSRVRGAQPTGQAINNRSVRGGATVSNLTALANILLTWNSKNLESLLKALELGARNNQNIGQMVDRICKVPVLEKLYSNTELYKVYFQEFNVNGQRTTKKEILRKLQQKENLAWFKGIKRKSYTDVAEWSAYVSNMMDWVIIQSTKLEVDDIFDYKLQRLIGKVNRIMQKIMPGNDISQRYREKFNNLFIALKQLTEDPQSFGTDAKQTVNTMESLKLQMNI